MKINYQNVAIIVALVLAALGLILPQQAAQPAPVAPVASTQSFACGAGTLCVTSGGRVVDMLSGGTFNINSGAVFTNSGLTQYAVSYFGTDAVNGTMVAHGLAGAPTYPSCMVYNAGFVTATVQISASNATSVTFRMFDTSGNAWTTPALAVRCSAVYVP